VGMALGVGTREDFLQLGTCCLGRGRSNLFLYIYILALIFGFTGDTDSKGVWNIAIYSRNFTAQYIEGFKLFIHTYAYSFYFVVKKRATYLDHGDVRAAHCPTPTSISLQVARYISPLPSAWACPESNRAH